MDRDATRQPRNPISPGRTRPVAADRGFSKSEVLDFDHQTMATDRHMVGGERYESNLQRGANARSHALVPKQNSGLADRYGILSKIDSGHSAGSRIRYARDKKRYRRWRLGLDDSRQKH